MTHPLYNNSGLQKNNKKHVLYALANKQMQLKKLEDEYETKIEKIKIDLTALETTICLFDGDCNKTIKKLNTKTAKSTPRKRNKYFVKGECRKMILTTLRTSATSLKTGEISLKIQDIKKIDKNDSSINRNIQKLVVEHLRVMEKSNLVTPVGKDGLNILWSIKSN